MNALYNCLVSTLYFTSRNLAEFDKCITFHDIACPWLPVARFSESSPASNPKIPFSLFPFSQLYRPEFHPRIPRQFIARQAFSSRFSETG